MKHSDIEIDRQLESPAPYVPDMSTPIGRLRHLRRVVEGVPEKQFNIRFVAQKTECGTVGCILGHAAFDPAFNAIGLRADHVMGPHYSARFGAKDCGVDYVNTGARFLGVDWGQSRDLFTSEPHTNESCPITKSHGIARIDRLIAELSCA